MGGFERAIHLALKPLTLECHVNILNLPNDLEVHNLRGCTPYGETEKLSDLVRPKYELPNMEKKFYDVPHDGSTQPCTIVGRGRHSFYPLVTRRVTCANAFAAHAFVIRLGETHTRATRLN